MITPRQMIFAVAAIGSVALLIALVNSWIA